MSGTVRCTAISGTSMLTAVNDAVNGTLRLVAVNRKLLFTKANGSRKVYRCDWYGKVGRGTLCM